MNYNTSSLVSQTRWVSLVAVAALAACLLGNSTAMGQIIASDDFSDGDFTAGDLSWVAVRGDKSPPFPGGVPTLEIVDDSGVGQIDDGNALKINRSNKYSAGTATTGAIAFLPGGGRQLENVNDFIKITFDVRFLGLPTTKDNGGTNRGFRVGFVNAGGDQETVGPGRVGDLAYYTSTGVGVASGSTDFKISQEFDASGSPMDGNDATESPIQTMASVVNDETTVYSGSLMLTKKMQGSDLGVEAVATFNGATAQDFWFAGNHTQPNPPNGDSIDLDRFDYIGFMGAKLRDMDILVDNVEITSNAPIAVDTGLLADFNEDDKVDGADFLAWQQGFGTAFDATDLANFQDEYGSDATVPETGAVPEPSALLLAGAMSLVLGGWRRR